MVDQKVTDMTELTTPADEDIIYIIDVSDTTDSSEGTSKKIKKSNLVSVGAITFLALQDTPSAYTGHYGEFLVVDETSSNVSFSNYAYHFSAIDDITNIVYTAGLITQITFGSGRVIDYSYDANGLLMSKTDGVYQWDYTYTSGQLTSTTVTKL